MKNKIILLASIFLLSLTSCSNNKKINKEKAMEIADSFAVDNLKKYEDKVNVKITYHLDSSGSFLEGGDLYNSLPILEESESLDAAYDYFYTKEKIDAIDENTVTSNGIETSNYFYKDSEGCLIIEEYSKIKSKANAISYVGYDITKIYLFNDGRINKKENERKISIDNNKDDLSLSGHYHYKILTEMSWTVIDNN